MKLKFKLLGLMLLGVLFFVGCGSSKQEAAEAAAQLKGKWVVTSATRGGEPTQALESAFFDFKDGKVMTNMPLDETTEGEYETTFLLEEGKITLPEKNNANFLIDKQEANELVLKAKLVEQDFVLTLKKAEDS